MRLFRPEKGVDGVLMNQRWALRKFSHSLFFGDNHVRSTACVSESDSHVTSSPLVRRKNHVKKCVLLELLLRSKQKKNFTTKNGGLIHSCCRNSSRWCHGANSGSFNAQNANGIRSSHYDHWPRDFGRGKPSSSSSACCSSRHRVHCKRTTSGR